MDHFGIGSAISGLARLPRAFAGRRSGRTHRRLSKVLKSGDRVVFLSEREGRRGPPLCYERDVKHRNHRLRIPSLDRLLARPPRP